MSANTPRRIDVMSDTHGYLSPELLEAIKGADLLLHAGDLTSTADWQTLCSMGDFRAVLGNNDYRSDYNNMLDRLLEFDYEGLHISMAHYREDLPVGTSDIAICGHTHIPKIRQVGKCLVVNPGSASYPRSVMGPTIARLFVLDGAVVSSEIVQL